MNCTLFRTATQGVIEGDLIEHIFGFVEGAMNGSLVRSIAIIRAKASTALTCLVYNIFRFVQILRYHPQWVGA